MTSLVVRAGEGGPRILLHGHVDVVPGKDSQFEAREEQDEVSALGATVAFEVGLQATGFRHQG